MFDIHRVELDWGGRKLTLETGKIARQADGAVLATYGETKLLATVVAAMKMAIISNDVATGRRMNGREGLTLGLFAAQHWSLCLCFDLTLPSAESSPSHHRLGD